MFSDSSRHLGVESTESIVVSLSLYFSKVLDTKMEIQTTLGLYFGFTTFLWVYIDINSFF